MNPYSRDMNKLRIERLSQQKASNPSSRHTQNSMSDGMAPNEAPPPYTPRRGLDPATAAAAFAAVDQAVAEYNRSRGSARQASHQHHSHHHVDCPNYDPDDCHGDPDLDECDEACAGQDEEMDEQEDTEAESEQQQPNTLHIDASTVVTGSGNIVHAEAISSIGARAAAAVASILKEPYLAPQGVSGERPRPTRLGARPLHVSLNLGVRVEGNRNMIAAGPVGPMQQRVPQPQSQPQFCPRPQGQTGQDQTAFAWPGPATNAPRNSLSPVQGSSSGQASQTQDATTGQKRKASNDESNDHHASERMNAAPTNAAPPVTSTQNPPTPKRFRARSNEESDAGSNGQ